MHELEALYNIGQDPQMTLLLSAVVQRYGEVVQQELLQLACLIACCACSVSGEVGRG